MGYPQQVQNKPTAAYWLSMIGGILGLLASLAFIAFGAMAYMALNSISSYYGYGVDLGMFGWGWTTLVAFGLWMLITSILVMVFAGKLKANPMEHTKWGALILVFSLIGVGGLLGFIGGILALVYKPIPMAGAPQPYGYAPQQPQQPQYYPPQQQYAQAPPQQQQQITRICPSCGRVVDENLKFCPHCGRQLG